MPVLPSFYFRTGCKTGISGRVLSVADTALIDLGLRGTVSRNAADKKLGAFHITSLFLHQSATLESFQYRSGPDLASK